MTDRPDLDAIGKQAVYWEKLSICEIEGFCNDVVKLFHYARALEAELAKHLPPYPTCDACGVQFVPEQEGQTLCEHHIESGVGTQP